MTNDCKHERAALIQPTDVSWCPECGALRYGGSWQIPYKPGSLFMKGQLRKDLNDLKIRLMNVENEVSTIKKTFPVCDSE